MFVDASAIVAIMTCESQADELADRLERADRAVTSALAVFEATLAVARKRRIPVMLARDGVQEFLILSGIRITSITPADGETALDAFNRYGNGQGHPAQLNMGDCFAYAAARSRDMPLLYAGNDFSQTDIA